MGERLKEKIALVTGSTSGLGKGIALEFARQGARVVVTGRRQELGEEVVAAIRAEGGEAVYCRADITDKARVEALCRFAGETYGGLDILVNNAGDAGYTGAASGRIGDTSEEQWDRLYAISLRGTCFCIKYALPYMLARGGGSIINMSSIQALRGMGWDAYSMVKAGLVGLTKSMAVSYAGDHVRVNCICPGSVVVEASAQQFADNPGLTRFANRLALLGQGEPADIAHAAVYLASDESRWVTGSIFTIDGGSAAKIPGVGG